MHECPHCGTVVPPPAERSAPEFVDGDLFELDADTLARMREAAFEIDGDDVQAAADYQAELVRKRVPRIGVAGHLNRFAEKRKVKKAAITNLRELMAWWAGHHRAENRTDAEIYRIFYLTFDVDWLTAMTLEAAKANLLIEKIATDMI